MATPCFHMCLFGPARFFLVGILYALGHSDMQCCTSGWAKIHDAVNFFHALCHPGFLAKMCAKVLGTLHVVVHGKMHANMPAKVPTKVQAKVPTGVPGQVPRRVLTSLRECLQQCPQSCGHVVPQKCP